MRVVAFLGRLAELQVVVVGGRAHLGLAARGFECHFFTVDQANYLTRRLKFGAVVGLGGTIGYHVVRCRIDLIRTRYRTAVVADARNGYQDVARNVGEVRLVVGNRVVGALNKLNPLLVGYGRCPLVLLAVIGFVLGVAHLCAIVCLRILGIFRVDGLTGNVQRTQLFRNGVVGFLRVAVPCKAVGVLRIAFIGLRTRSGKRCFLARNEAGDGAFRGKGFAVIDLGSIGRGYAELLGQYLDSAINALDV